MYNEKAKERTKRYLKKLKTIQFRVKPIVYDHYKAAATIAGYKSMRQFYMDAIDEKMDRIMERENFFYVYGMRERKFGKGCQPMHGYEKKKDDPAGVYYDVLFYNRMLTAEEIENYELDFMGLWIKGNIVPVADV